MDTQAKMNRLLAASRQVITDCTLINGAIVAANTDMPYSSKGTNDYRFVWPRDAAFMIYAGTLLDIHFAKKFCMWLLERAESFEELGLFSRRYATNGPCSSPESEYQPDQSGALLWALCSSQEMHSPYVRQAVTVIADTLCRAWNHTHFTGATFDLWEQFQNSEQSGSFVYSMAACITGLKAAHHIIPGHYTWLRTAEEMFQLLSKDEGAYFMRLTNHADDRIDASLLALVWPFRVTDDTEKLHRTVNRIADTLWINNGLYRFENDVYDGIVERSQNRLDGAGSWPILTCWYAIALHELGETDKAARTFKDLVTVLPEQWIPEQLLSGHRQAVSPLGWSHAMYIVAYHRLFGNRLSHYDPTTRSGATSSRLFPTKAASRFDEGTP